MIPLAHAAHWVLYALPVFVLTLGLTVLALIEARARGRRPPGAKRNDGES